MRAIALSIILLAAQQNFAADWAQFKGPGGSGVSSESGLPTSFTKEAGLRWKATLPGRGVSSPVIVGGRVYVTCSSGTRDDRLHVLAFDAGTGTQLWHRQLAATGGTACHPKTCMAAPTPVADSTGVYALFATGDVVAYDRDGTMRWYRSLVGDYPTLGNQVGMASSPLLFKDKLIIPMDNVGDSFVAALDIQTGKNVWKTARPKDVNWTTPVLRTLGEKGELIFPGNREVFAYDAETGSRTWSTKPGGAIPTPTIAGNLLIIPARELLVSSLEENGIKEVWKSIKMPSGMSSPLVYDGHIYAAAPAGIVTCAELKTGNVLWQERVRGPFSGSPVAGDGKIYVINETGVLTVLKAGKETEVLGESKTNEEGLATPAISGGAIFLRGQKTLFCIGSALGG